MSVESALQTSDRDASKKSGLTEVDVSPAFLLQERPGGNPKATKPTQKDSDFDSNEAVEDKFARRAINNAQPFKPQSLESTLLAARNLQMMRQHNLLAQDNQDYSLDEPAKLSGSPDCKTDRKFGFLSEQQTPKETTAKQNKQQSFLSDISSLTLACLPTIIVFEQTRKNAAVVKNLLELDNSQAADKQLAANAGNKDVEIIDFSTSATTDTALELLAKYPNLREVRLRAHGITAATIEHLKKVPNLEKLNLRLAKLGKGVLEQLVELKSLRDLNLGDATVNDEDLQKATTPVKLEKLDLSGLQIVDSNGNHIWDTKNIVENTAHTLAINSPSLKELDLSYLDLKNLDLSGLKKCKQLSCLELRNTHIDSEGISILKDMPLHTLILDDNKITDQHLAQIASIGGLNTLRLDNNPITLAGIEHLKALKSLALVSLTDTAISPEQYFHIKDTLLKNRTVVHREYNPLDNDREPLAKKESVRKGKELDLIRQFGLKLSGYEVFKAPEEGVMEYLRCKPPLEEELSVVGDVLGRGIVDPRSGDKPLRFVFINGAIESLLDTAAAGTYLETRNELLLRKGLACDLYNGVGSEPGQTLQIVIMHEIGHSQLPDERFGPLHILNDAQLKTITHERLKLIEEKLGFKLVSGWGWLLEGKKDKNGINTWYRCDLSRNLWVGCDETGKRLDNGPIFNAEQMQKLSRVHFPTPYFPNPEELMCEALRLMWLGGEARQHLAADCPEVYEVAMEEDRRIIKGLPDDFEIIKTLKAAHPGKEIVRGLDGHLTTVDNPRYQKELIEFKQRVDKGRAELKRE